MKVYSFVMVIINKKMSMVDCIIIKKCDER